MRPASALAWLLALSGCPDSPRPNAAPRPRLPQVKLPKQTPLANARSVATHSVRERCSAGLCTRVCEVGQACRFSCSGGGCTDRCEPGSSCDLTCSGGMCTHRCEGGASCRTTCSGGNCEQRCEAASQCEATCSGSGCS